MTLNLEGLIPATVLPMTAEAEIDELGFFVLGPPPNIPYRLVCTTQSGTTILTGWITP